MANLIIYMCVHGKCIQSWYFFCLKKYSYYHIQKTLRQNTEARLQCFACMGNGYACIATSKLILFFQKWSNVHERSEIGWIERKIKFKVFSISIFRVTVIFLLKLPQFLMNFHDILKNKNRKNRKIDFSFDSAHCPFFIKTGAKLRGGEVCISLVGKRQNSNGFIGKTKFRSIRVNPISSSLY